MADSLSLLDFGVHVGALAVALVVVVIVIYVCKTVITLIKNYVFGPLVFVLKVAGSLGILFVICLIVQTFVDVGASKLSPALQHYFTRWYQYIDLALQIIRENSVRRWITTATGG